MRKTDSKTKKLKQKTNQITKLERVVANEQVEKFEKLENRAEKAIQTVRRIKPKGGDSLSDDLDKEMESENEPLTTKYEKPVKEVKKVKVKKIKVKK